MHGEDGSHRRSRDEQIKSDEGSKQSSSCKGLVDFTALCPEHGF